LSDRLQTVRLKNEKRLPVWVAFFYESERTCAQMVLGGIGTPTETGGFLW